MTAFRGIPIVTAGSKYRTPQGFNAIKHGVKQRGDRPATVERKPEWLKIRLPSGGKYAAVRETVRTHELATVCEESMCPNIGECWSKRASSVPSTPVIPEAGSTRASPITRPDQSSSCNSAMSC
jgi:lipoic acid synthetase